VATLQRHPDQWDQTGQYNRHCFSCHPDRSDPAFSCAGFYAPGHVVEGPWQRCSITQTNGTKPANRPKRSLSEYAS
jgi:hypothetical protein